MNESNKTMRWFGVALMCVGIILLVIFYLNNGYKKTEGNLDSDYNSESAVSTSTTDVSTTTAVIPVKNVAPNTNAGMKITNVKIVCTGGDLCNPPVMSSIQIRDITNKSAIISWTTDQPATTEIFYSTSSLFASTGKLWSVRNPALSNFHQIDMDFLDAHTNHNYVLRSTNSIGMFSTTSVRSFTTLGQ